MTPPDQGSPNRFTRRSVIASAAAAGTASILRPAAGFARAAAPPPVFSRWIGSVDRGTRELPAPRPFTLVGVQWSGPRGARIELRTRPASGPWSRWAVASVLGHGPDLPSRPKILIGDPIWTGWSELVQLRSSQPLRGVRIHFVDVPDAPAAHAAALPLAQPVLPAGPGQPTIIARRAWSHGAPLSVRPGYGTIKLAFVHHTDNPNGYSAGQVPAMLLAIYQFHRFVRGWHDIGYNFVIDLFGRIWEARAGGIDAAVVGAQAGGYNLVSTGVAVLGTFMDVVPSPTAIHALEHLLAWKLSLHGVPTEGDVTVRVDPADAFYTPFRPGQLVSLPRIAGHRDGDSTDCPGNAFYNRLPEIRPVITGLAKTPARLTIARSAGSVSGTLSLLSSGQPVAGAPLEVQRLTRHGPVPIGNATTATDGSWSAALALPRHSRVRAVDAKFPAAVSDYV
jgi:hypothetical protein